MTVSPCDQPMECEHVVVTQTVAVTVRLRSSLHCSHSVTSGPEQAALNLNIRIPAGLLNVITYRSVLKLSED